jgi:outer membrane protein assembly factor BamD (BamD/ComL family)
MRRASRIMLLAGLPLAASISLIGCHAVPMAPTRADITNPEQQTTILTPASTTYTLGSATEATPPADGTSSSLGWTPAQKPAEGSEEATIANARRHLAEDRASDAEELMDDFIEARQRSSSPLLPQAYLIRGDARVAQNDEYDALYDYESIIRQFPGSPEFVTALEREMEIAVQYLNGRKRKFLGIRWLSGVSTGEELLIRIHERLPGSRLAERSMIELADFYYRTRDLESAAIVYELFNRNHPRSPYALRANQRQIFSNLGQYKGPAYDGTLLIDSEILIDRFKTQYPAQASAVGLDEALLARIDESQAQTMLDAANWYLTREDPVSARAMLRRLHRLHPQSAAGGEALDILMQRGWMEGATAAAEVPSTAPSNPTSATPPAEVKP